MKTTLLFLCVMLTFLVATTMTIHSLALAETANWSEVATFTGQGSTQTTNTANFTIDHPEWQIQWAFAPVPNFTAYAVFIVSVYPQGRIQNYVAYIHSVGGSPTSGTVYVHNTTGIFYMSVEAGNLGILNYTLIVQQDLNSVPEFAPSAILPLALSAALLVTIDLAYRKQRSRKSELRLKTN